MNIDAYLDDGKYGIYTYLLEQKKNGRIRHLGFSAHGSVGVMKRFLDAYGKDMEFCQIQLNWLDWDFQNARAKMELLDFCWDIPVWVMEPLRGGRLAKLSENDEAKLTALRPDEKVPAWAFRFIQTLPQVKVVLSGMSNFEQLQENIETFAAEKPLNKEEMQELMSVVEGMLDGSLPCTACRYCTSQQILFLFQGCPQMDLFLTKPTANEDVLCLPPYRQIGSTLC